MSSKQYTPSIYRIASAACLTALLCTSVHAGSAYERGPAPTVESISTKGSYEIASYVITRANAKGYGGATVHYPKAGTQTFGIVSLTPGFLATQSYYKLLSEFIASHGFVVINMDPITIYDQPAMRATEMAAALKQVVNMASAGNVPFASVTDVTRRAVSGHSMGGGGTLSAAQADPTLKAAVPLAPWHLTKNFSRVDVPTLIVACQNDNIATNKQHADVFYASLAADLPRGEVEIKGADHMCSTHLAPKFVDEVGKATVAWLKRFVDEDTRYDALVKGGMNIGDFSRFDVKGF
jgi:triacylglycerol lipase